MNTKQLPIDEDDAYPIVTPINNYIIGFDLLSEQCSRTNDYRNTDPGSERFQKYLFWRKNIVIWACCMIESFVNLEGVPWMGEEFYKKAIERQNIINKIRLVHAIKYSRLLDHSEEILKNIQRLFDLRNKFVHPKTRQFNDSSKNNDESMEFLENLNPTELKELVLSVNGLIRHIDDRQ